MLWLPSRLRCLPLLRACHGPWVQLQLQDRRGKRCIQALAGFPGATSPQARSYCAWYGASWAFSFFVPRELRHFPRFCSWDQPAPPNEIPRSAYDAGPQSRGGWNGRPAVCQMHARPVVSLCRRGVPGGECERL